MRAGVSLVGVTMFGLLLTVCILIALGFVYVWIANVVAHEEVSVGVGVAILVLAGIANFALNFLLGAALGGTITLILSIPLNFLVLAGLTHLLAKINFKQSLIVAAIFTVLMFMLSFGMTMCAASLS
jgi:hypothetical protein